jgi:hypothetical protein
MMWMPSTCVIALGLLWLASLCILAAVAIAVVVTKSRNRKAVAAGTSREGHQS